MEKKRKRVTAPRIAATLSALLAGAALYTVSGSQRQGIQVKEYAEAAEAAEAADSTIMVYMNGSDLEGDYGAATADLWEMMDALKEMGQEVKSPSLHVVVEAGGSTRWELDEMDGVPYARFSLTEDGISSMESMEIRNMGDADTLTDFINYGVQSYPADHYGLILWNHGGGPVGGYGSDSHFDGDGLSLEEIREALDHSVMADSAFDFVAFDACLMGSVEIAGCLDGYADYVIASPELEPQHGYDYRWMTALGDSLPPDMEWGEAVGRSMVEAYDAYYASGTAPVAMSLLDMKEYPAFHEVFHQYVDGIPEKLREELYGELGRDRMKMLAFGSRQAGGSPELVDVLEFLNACQRVYPDENAFQTLKDRMRRLVTEQWAKGYPVNPSGLTIYLPSGSNPYLSEDLETYDTTGFCSAYRQLTDGYAAYLARESGVEWGNISAHKDGTVEISIAPEDVSDTTGAYLAVFFPAGDDENYYLLCTDSDVDIGVDGTLRAAPEDSYMGMKGQVLCLIETMNLDAYTEYMAPVLYNGELCTMRIGFDEEHEDGQILSVTPAGQTSEAAKQIYELKEGDRVTPLYLVESMEDVEEESGGETRDDTRDDTGDSLSDTSNASAQIPEDRYYTDSYYMGTEFYIEEPDDMLLETVPASGDGYLYGFMLMDVRQNIYYTDFIGMGAEDTGS
ncbi:clostripain-related cysteine peptidase [Enterocloster clostridioformis]|uniref:clostripain-related cysteine peptidase n=1 Tax=Enterocloster clostridioformis TaxID=1531 RepID=UPI00041C330B|nr:clostripain-related cysteine peptidase [Enterocloster clostridioformis]